MYNGNNNSYGTGGPRRGSGIPPLYIYIGVGLLVLLVLWLISGFLRATMESYFALAAGILLVLGNLRDLIANPYPNRSNVSLLNTLIGGGLIFYWLGNGLFPPLGWVWYIPAIVLMLIAAPLMLGRAAVYTAYIGTARRAIGTVKNAVGNRIRTY